MRYKFIGLFLSLILALFPLAGVVGAQSGIQFTDNQATIQFPESITFSAEIQSDATLTTVVLEYGVDQLTCGTVIAKAFPVFLPSKSLQVEWTWEMRQSGSLPPGTKIWWLWRATDANGNEAVSNQGTIIWLDDVHAWETITGGNVNLHWYGSDRAFGQELHSAAVDALTHLARDTGLQPDSPIDLYIYADTNDMRDAILYEPGWTGGMAFPEHNIVIIGISPNQMEWGKRTEAHELTHVLVGHLTFSCLGFVPTWLNEGLAVYGEGGLTSSEQVAFNEAVANDTLISVRSLSGGFSEVPSTADLSYSESYSIVKFLIDEYGKQKILDLLMALRDGETIDDALLAIYGFNVDGLEDAWRASIGAQPRAIAPNPTATPTPTLVPTIVPFSGAPAAPAPFPTSAPTLTPNPTPVSAPESPTAPGVSLPSLPFLDSEILTWVPFAMILCILGLALVIGPIIVTARRRHRRKN